MLIGIALYEGFDMLDVTGPWEMFQWAMLEKGAADLSVQLVAEVPGKVASNFGLGLEVLTGLDSAPQFDVLWTPGGSPEALHRVMYGPNQAFLNFLRKQAPGARYVCSVCEGAMLLAQAGLLEHHTATTHWAFVPCFLDRFPNVTMADGFPRYVLDRDRLTGGGISSGLDESLELIRLLYGKAVAEAVQQNTQYYPDPPVSSRIPQTNSCPVAPAHAPSPLPAPPPPP